MNRARQVSLQTGKPVSGELLEDGDLSLQAEVIFVHQLLDDPSTHCQAHSRASEGTRDQARVRLVLVTEQDRAILQQLPYRHRIHILCQAEPLEGEQLAGA